MNARLRVLLLACLPGLALAQAESLKHDPFARPASLARPANTTGATGQAIAVQAPAAAPDWKPELRAVMLAGENSMVNIDGTLISLGGQFNGYRLVEVREEAAVLANGSKRVRLPLRGDAIKLEGK